MKKKYKIVFWDVLAGDFDLSQSTGNCFKNITNHSTDGSIVVLHDNVKSWDRLEFVLPSILKYYSDLGFTFESIPSD